MLKELFLAAINRMLILIFFALILGYVYVIKFSKLLLSLIYMAQQVLKAIHVLDRVYTKLIFIQMYILIPRFIF